MPTQWVSTFSGARRRELDLSHWARDAPAFRGLLVAAASLTWPADATLVFSGSGRRGGRGALEADMAAAT